MRILVIFLAVASLALNQALTLEDVLSNAEAYVTRFEEAFSTLVAEERYTQQYTLLGSTGPGRRPDIHQRILKSDFLLVRSERSDTWVPFRDVFEADGRPLREREDRLTKLFVEASEDAYQQAHRISNESTRYNIGPVTRTVNVPTLPLKFLTSANARRSMFQKAGEVRLEGVPVWEIRLAEMTVPTLIRTSNDMSLPAEGTFWIEPVTGAVLKAQLRLRTRELRSEITVTYNTFENLDVRVPGELKEKYQGLGFELEGTATYGRLRRFRVTTEEVIQKN
ncbi:MAG: hypothetical protein ACRD1Q_01705 [Vicinamibacterales bacterium]